MKSTYEVILLIETDDEGLVSTKVIKTKEIIKEDTEAYE